VELEPPEPLDEDVDEDFSDEDFSEVEDDVLGAEPFDELSEPFDSLLDSLATVLPAPARLSVR
jgi:hypothetical protein